MCWCIKGQKNKQCFVMLPSRFVTYVLCIVKISVTAVEQQSSQTEREPKSDRITVYTYASTVQTSVDMCVYIYIYIPRYISKSNNLLFPWPMKTVMRWPFVCQFLQIKLLFACYRGLCLCLSDHQLHPHHHHHHYHHHQARRASSPSLIDLQQQKDAHSARKTFGNPSQSCSPETRLCCVILSGQVTKVGPSDASTDTRHTQGTDQQITLHDSYRRVAALLLRGQNSCEVFRDKLMAISFSLGPP